MTTLDTIPLAVAAAMLLLSGGYALGRRERDPAGTITALRNQLRESERLRAISRDVYTQHLKTCPLARTDHGDAA